MDSQVAAPCKPCCRWEHLTQFVYWEAELMAVIGNSSHVVNESWTLWPFLLEAFCSWEVLLETVVGSVIHSYATSGAHKYFD
jgi:hypothetical protein